MKLKSSLCLGIALIITACGGSSESSADKEQREKQPITPETTTISGTLGKAYTVVDKKYKPQGETLFKKLNVEIELTDPSKLPDLFLTQKVGTEENEGDADYPILANFIIEFLDEEGDVIKTDENGDGIDRLIRLTEQGDKATISFYLPDNLSDVKFFRIISDFYPNKTKAEGSTGSEMELNDEEFNTAMKHYEKAVETSGKVMKNMLDIINQK